MDSPNDLGCGDLQRDPLNCGSCGHDCLGGECLAGKCQPAVVADRLNARAFVENLDDRSLYFSTCSDDFTLCDVWTIGKSSRSGTPTLITSGGYFAIGVIGSKLLLHSLVAGNDELECDLGSGCGTYLSLPNGGAVCSFKSPSPTYIPMWSASNGIWKVSWFTSDHSPVASYSEAIPPSATYRTIFATGDAIYWIRAEPGSGGTTHTLFGIHASDSATTRLAGSLAEAMNIVDVSSRSILLRDSQAIYRVPVGGVSAPQQLASPAGYAVEDEHGVYWMDDAGTVYRCDVASCASTKTVMASGYPKSSAPSQDDVALYWGTGSPNQVLRLAK